MKTLAAVFLLMTIQINLTTIHSLPTLLFQIENYDMPEVCKDATYCFEKGPLYPSQRLENLTNIINELYIDDSYADSDEPSLDIDERVGIVEDTDCPSNKTDKPIYYIVDTTDTVRVVVQVPRKFEQIYTVEWCLKEGQMKEDSSNFLNLTFSHHDMECVTMRMNFDFIVLSENGRGLERVQAKDGIPVCCRCRQMDKKEGK